MSGLLPPNILAYEGQVAVPFINRTAPPTKANNNFNVPTIWVDTELHNAYLLVAKPLGVADWILIGGAPGVLATLTGNSGGAVSPMAGNITFQGDGTTILVVGNPGTHTLTISTTGVIATTYTTNSGSAAPSGGNLNILGGTGISTSGAGSTVTVNLSSPVSVANGGTGATTLTGVVTGNGTSAFTASPVTQHDVLVGAASNLITSVAPSATTGVPLVSQGAAADPAFGIASIAGGGTFASSFSTTNGVVKYDGTRLVTSTTSTISSTGIATNTAQPCFLTYLSGTQANVTGDGTIFQIVFDTSVFDQNSNYSTGTGLFTAPVTGKYQFSAGIFFNSVSINMSSFEIRIVATSITIRHKLGYSASGVSPPGTGITVSVVVSMTAGDTAQVQGAVGGSTKTAGVLGGGSPIDTFFSGSLLC